MTDESIEVFQRAIVEAHGGPLRAASGEGP